MIARNRTWDQALALGNHGGYRRYWVRRLVTIVVVLAVSVGLLPGVARAHYDPGGTQIGGAELDAPHEAIGAQGFYVGPYPFPVSGRGFVALDKVLIFLCPRGETDLLNKCLAVGAAVSDANGAFSTQAVVPSFRGWVPPSGTLTSCQTRINNLTQHETVVECSVAAATFDPFLQQPTSMADHYVCFGYSECTTNRDGSPTTTTTTTTIGPPPPPEWQPAAPLKVARQYLATAVGADGRIYALGGHDGAGNALDSVETMDPCGPKTWSLIAPMPTPRTDLAAATGPDGRIYAIGGREGDGTPLATVEAYDPATNTWSTAASLATPRTRLAATTGPDGLIYAVGGLSGDGRSGALIVEAYDTAINQWRPVTPLPPPGQDDVAGAVLGPDGRIYAMSTGGGSLSYSPGPEGTPATWREEPTTPDLGWNALGAATTGPDGLIYFIGTLDYWDGSLRTVRIFDTATDTWHVSPEALTGRRSGNGSATGRDGRIYAIGGQVAWTEQPPLASTESQKLAPSSCPPGRPPADFDGDAKTDVSVYRPSNGTWYFQQSTDGFRATAWGEEGDIPVPADYDGDSQTDIAVYRPSNGTWYLSQSTEGFRAIAWGDQAEGDIPVPGDYDGDSRADVAVYRPTNGTWYLSQSTEGFRATVWGDQAEGDIPVPGDYDGDGRSDIAVFRPTNGTWYLSQSIAGFAAPIWGEAGDVPVPGDYDGDHSTDNAVFRPSSGMWFLRHSLDNAVEVFDFGAGSDVPLPGDYNADGIADPALYRDGQWFIETGETYSWGDANDVPLPLPYAIRRGLTP